MYFPLANHFEQQHHVRHRLNRYRAGVAMDYATSTPQDIAATVAKVLTQPIDYLPVATDGAGARRDAPRRTSLTTGPGQQRMALMHRHRGNEFARVRSPMSSGRLSR